MEETCVFVRLSGCNLSCKFCDTAYSWYFTSRQRVNHKYVEPVDRNKNIIELNAEEVAAHIEMHAGQSTRRIVFTGGEPLLQQQAIAEILEILQQDDRWYVEVETNGTILLQKDLKIDQINCSPKLKNSGNGLSLRNKPEVIKQFMKLTVEDAHWKCNISFKFVVGLDTLKEDIEEIQDWQVEHKIPNELIYLIPEGILESQIKEGTKKLIDLCSKIGYKLSTRLHILIYGNKRGV